MELFDTHAHLNFPEFKEDFSDVIERCKENKLSYVLNVGIDIHSSQASLQLARDYDWIYASAGIHPHDAEQMDDYSVKALKLLAGDAKVVALGEMGLDYHRDLSPREKQKEVFREQITIAKEFKLPIIIHSRKASEDIMQILKEENAHEVGGIMHCFPGDWSMAKWCIDRNFLIGIGGPVTFKNGKKLQEVARRIPKDKFVIETDCPFLSPEPYRGKRNEPSFVKHVAKCIAELRGMNEEETAYWTTNNALKLFRI